MSEEKQQQLQQRVNALMDEFDIRGGTLVGQHPDGSLFYVVSSKDFGEYALWCKITEGYFGAANLDFINPQT